LIASGVSAGTYGDATHIPQITLDAKARVTVVSSVVLNASLIQLGKAVLSVAAPQIQVTIDPRDILYFQLMLPGTSASPSSSTDTGNLGIFALRLA
jgi:hypothetical protein